MTRIVVKTVFVHNFNLDIFGPYKWLIHVYFQDE